MMMDDEVRGRDEVEGGVSEESLPDALGDESDEDEDAPAVSDDYEDKDWA